MNKGIDKNSSWCVGLLASMEGICIRVKEGDFFRFRDYKSAVQKYPEPTVADDTEKEPEEGQP